jgi:hypothetical protein
MYDKGMKRALPPNVYHFLLFPLLHQSYICAACLRLQQRARAKTQSSNTKRKGTNEQVSIPVLHGTCKLCPTMVFIFNILQTHELYNAAYTQTRIAPHATRNINTQHTTHNTQHTTRTSNAQHATHNIQHTTQHNTQHATCNVQHATRNRQTQHNVDTVFPVQD